MTHSIFLGIGGDVAQDLASEVLKYSILAHTDCQPKIIKLHQTPEWSEMNSRRKKKQRTPFSFQRFLLARKLIDSNSDFGVYLDSDMLVLEPIENLVRAFIATNRHVATVVPMAQWHRRPQSSVMVMDHEGAELLWQSYLKYAEGLISYDDLIYLTTIGSIGSIDYQWNCLEYLDESTSLIHYTDMETQPWLRSGNPNAGIWYTYLWRLSQDAKGMEIIATEIARGHVRPSLREIVDNGPSLSSFSTNSRLKDMLFIPPHRFKSIRLKPVRSILTPLMNLIISIQFAITNGQPNKR